MHKIFLSSLIWLAEGKHKSGTRRCTETDIDRLGGGISAIMASLETCVPDIVTESTMALIEGCVEVAFVPENLSQNCNSCSVRFLENHELELKSCLLKCSGIARQSNFCLKCKETVETLWDETCLPRETKNSEDPANSCLNLSLKIAGVVPLILSLL